MLTEPQIDRYSRQIILPEVGARGQQLLLDSSVALIGAGEESALTLFYLAAAGVGRITVLSPNAHEWAHEALALNDDCNIEVVAVDVDSVEDASVILTSAPDAPISRRLAADCVRTQTPLLWSRIGGGSGFVGAFHPAAGSGCPVCFAAGIASADGDGGAIVASTRALLATILATEAIKLIEGLNLPESQTILRIEALIGTVTAVPAVKHPDCRVCGTRFSP